MKINYTPNSATATVMTSDGMPTTTALSANPAGALTTNQSVTLTATVSADSTPTGTVEFDSNGTPITGCLNRRLASDGQSATATCQTSFAAASNDSVTAVFRPPDGTTLQGSTDETALLVRKGSTTTTVSVSDPAPPVGKTLRYAATVAPDDAGAVEPSGAVQFLDEGIPIGACSNQRLSAGASSPVAYCTLSYETPGSHNITATYAGDDNFTGSTSPQPQVVTVHASAAPTNSSAPTPASSPATRPPATPVSAPPPPRCKLTLRTNRVVPAANTTRGRAKGNQRMPMLSVTCDQTAKVTVRGTIARQPGTASPRTRVFHLSPVEVTVKAWRASGLAIRLPRAALVALNRGSRETVTFTLSARSSGGTTRIRLTVPSLKLSRP